MMWAANVVVLTYLSRMERERERDREREKPERLFENSKYVQHAHA